MASTESTSDTDFQSSALPTELRRPSFGHKIDNFLFPNFYWKNQNKNKFEKITEMNLIFDIGNSKIKCAVADSTQF